MSSYLTAKRNGGSETVEFLVFNYDGKGGALVRYEDGTIEGLSEKDVNEIILGTNNKERQYTLIFE